MIVSVQPFGIYCAICLQYFHIREKVCEMSTKPAVRQTGVIPQTKSNARCAFHYAHVSVAFQFKSSITALAQYTRNCKKMQLFSVHTTFASVFHNSSNFLQQFYIWATIFKDFFRKNLCSVVCKGSKTGFKL